MNTLLALILDYILDLKRSGLSTSLIHMHLDTITAFHPKIDGYSMFTHLLMKRFLQGLLNLYPHIWHPTQPWDPNLILHPLTRSLFEPMATCSFIHLSIKTAFLVAIMLARWIGEIGALMAYPPYNIFPKDRVMLHTHPKFLPKVPSFHLNQPIYLPCFFPKSHSNHHEAMLYTWDVGWALAFYLDRTESPRLFLSTTEQLKGMAVSNIFPSGSHSTFVTNCTTSYFHLHYLSQQCADHWHLKSNYRAICRPL